MKFKLALASLSVLGLLSGFVVAIVMVFLYLSDMVSAPLVIGITIIFNFIMWLLSPFISDFMYRWIYGVKFYNLEELQDKKYFSKLKEVCDSKNVKYPKIGIINDLNPTAFTYGSTKNNARIVYTKGIEHFLDDEEILAVLLHELGHVVHNDFIIMTIASTLLQILYEVYSFSLRASGFSNNKNKNENKNGYFFIIIAIVSYLFYIIGTYLVLFLSRIREYYADEFSAKESGNPNSLSNALFKIAYGITQTSKDKSSSRLLSSTRSLGIFDLKTANDVGLAYLNSKDDKNFMSQFALFDIFNPWAGFLELSSTHPLIGKRIKNLDKISSNPILNFDKYNSKINKFKLWKNFFSDIFIIKFPNLMFISVIITFVLNLFLEINLKEIMLVLFVSYTLTALFSLNYRYNLKGFKKTTTAQIMANVYASPVRGEAVELEGKVIGRGIPGLIISEDMIYQDKDGFIFLNYESKIPFFGNMFFGIKQHKEIQNVDSNVSGWFFRGNTHHIDLFNYSSKLKNFKSAVRFWANFWIIIKILLLGAIVFII